MGRRCKKPVILRAKGVGKQEISKKIFEFLRFYAKIAVELS